MSNATLEKLTWVLIYGGLLTLCLGVFVLREAAPALGWGLVAGGVVAAVLGLLAAWRRSRRPAAGR